MNKTSAFDWISLCEHHFTKLVARFKRREGMDKKK
jgi:hypothetical protein